MDKSPETLKRSKSEAAKLSQQTLASGAAELKSTVQQVIKRKPGQPTKFTPEKWTAILECVATYGDLIEVCTAPDMPSVQTVYQWIREDAQLKEDMRGAWEAFSMIGHSVNNNILRGGVLSTGDFRRDEALANQNRWFMSKTNRRDFGEKVQVDVVEHKVFVLPGDAIEGEGY